MGFGLGAFCALMPMTAHASAADTFYERAVMTAADERCRLFTPQISSALAAGRAQARGAALRTGVSEEVLKTVENRARAKAQTIACASADMTTAAQRVRDAYEPYSRQSREIYPGDFGHWTAARLPVARTPVWTLSQTASFGADRLIFGVAGQNGATSLITVAAFADEAQPYTARLIIRDVNRARQPYLDRRHTDARGKLPLSARTAPRSTTRAFLAEAKQPADPRLSPADAKSAIAFRFPAEASSAIAALDPREAIEIEFAFSTRKGDVVRRAYVEVGDFAAGRAFLQLAQR